MSTSILDQIDFIVVDPNPDDYTHLIPMIERQGANPSFFTTGHEAIKLATPAMACCWMINLELPDMRGIQLHGLLKNRIADASIFLVADEYEPQAEASVLCLGTAQFACKPLHPEWLLGGVRWDVRRRIAQRSRAGWHLPAGLGRFAFE